ncbi:MAG TPA: FliM/FliN family flagellar motor switch protein [Verrucomicrobiae bacterium]|jgi:flagellar motor switch protein FliM|nr:FliM/FliN family flagellar motor switch protein [Verrucomicrobiae bacterium]
MSDAAKPVDFRATSLLTQRQLRKLRAHEEQFLTMLEARVGMFLRSEFPLKLAGIEIVSYQKLTEGWKGPSHLTLFKAEPLRGVAILDIPVLFGLTIVDRLMGGAGKGEETPRELSEIENALLGQIVQIILEEWCGNWARLKALKPSQLGCETNGRFLQTASADTNMLVLCVDARNGESTGQLKLAFQYSALETLLRQLAPEADGPSEAPPPPAPTAPKWNRNLDDVELPVTAVWQAADLTARDVLHLQVGDVLPIGPQSIQVSLRLGDLSKFQGRLGTAGGHWAVELTRPAPL